MDCNGWKGYILYNYEKFIFDSYGQRISDEINMLHDMISYRIDIQLHNNNGYNFDSTK